MAVVVSAGLAWSASAGVVIRQDIEVTILNADNQPIGDIPVFSTGDRFRMEVTWGGFPSNSGPGALNNTFFFAQDNFDMLIEVLDNTDALRFSRHWVFAPGATNVEYQIAIGDNAQPFGPAGPTVDFIETAIVDVDAFSNAPATGAEGAPMGTFSLLFGMNGPTSIFNGLGLPTSVDFPAFTGGTSFQWAFSNGANVFGTITN
ncbi:MAG: hypothetical protein D6693_01770 [Planctomycetota bacterium]|nr:MAG: hypothetical protein D6693_01770 [Planctomycetota bacterium]